MKKIIPLILSTLLLTSCSGPDSSGGVEFSKTDNSFPYGHCRGSGHQTYSTEETGCGWITANDKSYYIMPDANLFGANLSGANLSNANLAYAILYDADLSGADLSGAWLLTAILSEANLNNANLTYAILNDAYLNDADLRRANLSDANLSGVKGNKYTTCPNGINWGTSGNNCGF